MTQLTKKDKTIKYISYCLILMLCAVLQNVGGLFFEIGGARCFFLVPVSVLLGIDEDERTSGLIGFFAGLLWDILSAQHMGFNCIFLMLICYLTSFLVSYLFRNAFWVGVIEAIIAVCLYCFTYWLVFMVFSSSEGSKSSLFYFYIPCAIYTAALTPAFNFLIRKLKIKLNKETQID